MAEKFTCKYLLGTCYTCKKCLYCFQQGLCRCKKDKQPARVSNPKRGQQIYQRVFTPNRPIPTANEFLFTANTNFNYNSNFNESFSYTFCAACNSKFQRLGDKDKGKKRKKRTKKTLAVNKIVTSDVEDKLLSMDRENDKAESINVKGDNSDNIITGTNNVGKDNTCVGEDNNVKVNDIIEIDSKEEGNSEEANSDEDNSDEDDDVKEVKVQITIKNKDKNTPTAKTLTIQPANYKSVVEKINSIVQKVLGKNIKTTYYTISYKAVNARGPSNELEDELDFQEFLNEYKKIISLGKKMSVIVDMKKNIKENKKFSKKHKKVMVRIFFLLL